MNLTTDQLDAVEQLAYRLITPQLIAINLGVDETDFALECRTPDSPVHKAYYKGYLKQLVETREMLIRTAQNGSNPAQLELLRFMKEIENHLHYE